MAKPSVVDISHWQNEPDFAKVKAAGVVGIILKATEGTGYTDPTYASRRKKANDVGLITSSYHFLKKGSIGAQMDYFLAAVNPVPGERVVIDYEDAALSLNDLREAIIALQSKGLQVTTYGANGFLGAQLKGIKDEILASTSLWVASYTTNPAPTMTDLKGTWPNWTLWQYTDKAPVSGFAAPVDGNVFNGSDENLIKWLSPAGTQPYPLPTPPPDADRPTITMTLESDVPVTIKVLGGVNVIISG